MKKRFAKMQNCQRQKVAHFFQQCSLSLDDVSSGMTFPDPSGERISTSNDKELWLNLLWEIYSRHDSHPGVPDIKVCSYLLSTVDYKPEKMRLCRVIVQQLVEKRIFTRDGRYNESGSKVNNVPGRHCVIPVTYGEGYHFHIKFCPELPGSEVATSLFASRIFGFGTPLVDFVILQDKDMKTIPALVSLSIRSAIKDSNPRGLGKYPNLDTVWKDKKDPSIFENLDERCCSQRILLSILVTNHDGKPSNYVLNRHPHSERYCLISVDNEGAFIPSINLNKIPPEIATKEFVFCLPQMNKPINKDVIEEFKRLSFRQVFKEWTSEIQELQNFFIQCWLPPRSPQVIPVIPFIEIDKLYFKAVLMKKMMKKNSSLTPMQILHKVEPVLEVYYKNLFCSCPDATPLERFSLGPGKMYTDLNYTTLTLEKFQTPRKNRNFHHNPADWDEVLHETRQGIADRNKQIKDVRSLAETDQDRWLSQLKGFISNYYRNGDRCFQDLILLLNESGDQWKHKCFVNELTSSRYLLTSISLEKSNFISLANLTHILDNQPSTILCEVNISGCPNLNGSAVKELLDRGVPRIIARNLEDQRLCLEASNYIIFSTMRRFSGSTNLDLSDNKNLTELTIKGFSTLSMLKLNRLEKLEKLSLAYLPRLQNISVFNCSLKVVQELYNMFALNYPQAHLKHESLDRKQINLKITDLSSNGYNGVMKKNNLLKFLKISFLLTSVHLSFEGIGLVTDDLIKFSSAIQQNISIKTLVLQVSQLSSSAQTNLARFTENPALPTLRMSGKKNECLTRSFSRHNLLTGLQVLM
eukprot:TRINITY_DN4220_c0_g1_i15.p1 TRINITY_DN4220_c0_g1~~TRINITY_DN4220_c0_g1_i15.p1  ORF type:complete len:809 (-),score=104.85 TRINITY_DN4220_c0_g1_i15:489-2915(-)